MASGAWYGEDADHSGKRKIAPQQGALERLERLEGKPSRAVLR
jgi:hypothetical protein